MTVHKLRHRIRLWKTVGVVALIALFYVLLGAILPARHHKQASAAGARPMQSASTMIRANTFFFMFTPP